MLGVILFFKGMAIGLAIAAPVGPIGVLCIQRTLARGFWAGLAGGLGTALADLTFATAAAAGFAVFRDLVARIALPLGLIGGAFLIYLAVTGWPRGPAASPRAATAPEVRSLWRTTLVTYGLTITNPPTILLFAAIFAGLGLAEGSAPLATAALVVGVFLGSMGWWAFLSGLVAALHHRLPPAFALWTARVSSLTMAGFGLWAFATALL
ncbi:LysE family translocator [Rhodobacter maris]|uniref:Putative LysE/RhtB family amino acid efflux pump n=1 Tax=Rhodobacter maris TaxID=446682 RepID=A0A285SZN1_9RHOB|nr:LysE family transporter [Rhodobacter maris]SOC12190.1 putative LysE/RhtB family amino acid efflux pump [Rhodobacter maris]